MLFKSALIGGLLAAGHATAFKIGQVNALLQRSDDVEEVLRRDAALVASLTRRQDANPADTAPLSSLVPASGDASKADLKKWEEETRSACMSTLSNLKGKASNPSGIAVCYNVPFLDNRTGVFQAELRLYNVSAPVDPWIGVTAADISLSLSYLGATVQNMNGTFQKRDIGYPPVRTRDTDSLLVERQTISDMTEFKVLMYVGRINSNLMFGDVMTEETLKPLLVPDIDLAARNPISNIDVTETLSSAGATFVNGIFASKADRPTTADPTAAAAASSIAAIAAPFVVPGTTLSFFPVGLVVTCIWSAVLFIAVGLGTCGRIQFRDQYRRRVLAEKARGVRTI
ncbi:hypothetical protein P153DRAFT_294895 [Dothidotthia symphoricarpi CBS 119687]|uniref:Uncharacterized protein n=1 Tax=Dothidotthia symphoricarpi CBS 119687 TaxID=1392245 RepID=A0A6A6A712_9PLEO|nr:uncharacterized protein P153DRAFT_294895 [Dothidotthia symphoricarpi CBS 119687]KAF2127610.1 hypothetical protein P153DRAFT_294895 [Dothidotthia symphoricarpi CBS 119687]